MFWEKKVTDFIATSVLKGETLKVILFASAFRSASSALWMGMIYILSAPILLKRYPDDTMKRGFYVNQFLHLSGLDGKWKCMICFLGLTTHQSMVN